MKIEIERDTEQLIAALTSWDGASPPFSDLVFAAIAHSALLGYGGTLITDLAAEVECGTSTVVRWARGGAPMPRLQKMIIASIAKRLRAQADEAAERHRAAHAAFRQMSLAAQATEEDETDE
jgi:hypothetical protein